MLGSKESRETQESRWDENAQTTPTCEDYAFTAWGKCSSCDEHFAISGRGSQQLHDVEGDLVKELYPRACYPMPEVIEIPTVCPREVGLALRNAFPLYWINAAACAGSIRIALELLMDDQKIPRRGPTKNGERRRMSLDARLKLFAAKHADRSAELLSIKWLGNTGAHTHAVTRDDLLDAFEILEYCLREIYDKPGKRISTLARNLQKKHKKG